MTVLAATEDVGLWSVAVSLLVFAIVWAPKRVNPWMARLLVGVVVALAGAVAIEASPLYPCEDGSLLCQLILLCFCF